MKKRERGHAVGRWWSDAPHSYSQPSSRALRWVHP